MRSPMRSDAPPPPRRHLAIVPKADESGELPTMPATRDDCVDGPRPCPHRRCSFHLAEDFPKATESCALDLAEEGYHSYRELAPVLGLSSARLEQIEKGATISLASHLRAFARHVPVANDHPLGAISVNEVAGMGKKTDFRRYPGELSPTWLRAFDRRVSDKHYAMAVRDRMARKLVAPCWEDKACTLPLHHEGVCEVPEYVVRERARRA